MQSGACLNNEAWLQARWSDGSRVCGTRERGVSWREDGTLKHRPAFHVIWLLSPLYRESVLKVAVACCDITPLA